MKCFECKQIFSCTTKFYSHSCFVNNKAITRKVIQLSNRLFLIWFKKENKKRFPHFYDLNQNAILDPVSVEYFPAAFWKHMLSVNVLSKLIAKNFRLQKDSQFQKVSLDFMENHGQNLPFDYFIDILFNLKELTFKPEIKVLKQNLTQKKWYEK